MKKPMFECWDWRRVTDHGEFEQVHTHLSLTRLGALVHGLVKHGVWATGDCYERRYWAAKHKENG